VGTTSRWVASPPRRGDGPEKVGNAHHGGLNHDLQDVADLALGRREFFGLLAWRTVSTLAGCILVGQLADAARGDDDPPPVFNDCDVLHPNRCVTQLNMCQPGVGTNRCTSGAFATNECGGQPAGANICRDLGQINACTGSSGQANKCTGGIGGENRCGNSQGANTCSGATGANTCQPASANKCVGEAANVCDPPAANQGVNPGTEPLPGGG